MEKFTSYRDPGTGIQPFLTPVPPLGSDIFAKLTLPLRYILGFARTTLVLLLSLIYFFFVKGVCCIFSPLPPLQRVLENIFTFLVGRAVLFILGFFWISVEQFNIRRGKGLRKVTEKWSPKAGDIIISNWASWIEIIWLALRFNPTFVLPVPESIPALPSPKKKNSSPRLNDGQIFVKNQIPILGFHRLSLFAMIRLTAHVFPFVPPDSHFLPLEEIIQRASGPVVVFPECTTSNGRGVLRFAKLTFKKAFGKHCRVYLMSVRYNPPTPLSLTLTHSIPSRFNPLPHIFSVTTSIFPAHVSIRLLAPSESQSLFSKEALSNSNLDEDDQFLETCASIISQMSKLKTTGLCWEDKIGFLQLYNTKS